MTDPIGQNSYKGLGVPLFGESVIRQQNSSNAILTLMHSTANTGRLLMGMDWKDIDTDPSSLLTDLAVFDINAEGAFHALSGTSVGVRLNTSGLFDSTDNRLINSSRERPSGVQQIVTISSDGTSAVGLTAANAGKLHVVSTQIASSIVLGLPSSLTTGLSPGMYWDVFMNTTVTAQLNIAVIGTDKSTIYCHMSTNTVKTSIGITNNTTGPFWVRIMCDTTGESAKYVVHNFMGEGGGSSGPTNVYYGIDEGSSALS